MLLLELIRGSFTTRLVAKQITVLTVIAHRVNTKKQGLAACFLARLEQATCRICLFSVRSRALFCRRWSADRQVALVELLAGVASPSETT